MSVLDDPTVRTSLLQAWRDSNPGTIDAHEEGGFVLRAEDGTLLVERWPRGEQSEIYVPLHMGGKRAGFPIIATFHTHPNAGADFQQEPSLTDVRAVRNDPNLNHPEYEGEYVIATESIFRIERSGRTSTIGDTSAILENE